MAAFSAAPPGNTDRTCGCTFGRTPTSPTSNRLCPMTVGVTLRSSAMPLRSRPIDTSRFAFVPTARRNCSHVLMPRPATDTMRSPGWMSEREAGEPSTTTPTMGG